MPLSLFVLTATLALVSAPAPVDAGVAAGQAYERRLANSLAASDAPRDRALYSMTWPFFDASDAGQLALRGAALRSAAQAAPDDRLVQWLWAIAPPEASGCLEGDPCSTRAFALARIEPDNAAAWFPIVVEVSRDSDIAKVDAVLKQMAAATYYDDLFVDAAIAWRDVQLRYPLPTSLPGPIAVDAPPPPAPAETAMIAGVARSAAMAIPSARDLFRACDRAKQPQAPPGRFDNCARIGRVLLRSGTTVMAQRYGLAMLRLAGAMGADEEAARRTMDWRMSQSARVYASTGEDLTAYFADLESTRSEVRAQEFALHRAGVPLEPPVGWQASSTPLGTAKP